MYPLVTFALLSLAYQGATGELIPCPSMNTIYPLDQAIHRYLWHCTEITACGGCSVNLVGCQQLVFQEDYSDNNTDAIGFSAGCGMQTYTFSVQEAHIINSSCSSGYETKFYFSINGGTAMQDEGCWEVLRLKIYPLSAVGCVPAQSDAVCVRQWLSLDSLSSGVRATSQLWMLLALLCLIGIELNVYL